MAHGAYRYFLVVAVLLCSAAARAQSSGALYVTARVERSVLLSGVTPGGLQFSQGGLQSAAAIITLLPGATTQTFSSHVLVANQPHSAGYELVARVLHSLNAKVTLDGVQLSTSDTVVRPRLPYGVVELHTVKIVEGGETALISIVLTVKPQ